MPSAPAFTPVDAADQAVYGAATTPIAAGATTTIVKPRAGRLGRVVVTTVGSVVTTFYDNASTGAGTIIAVIPAAAALGTVIAVDMPAANGIVAVALSGGAALTVSYS